LLEQRECLFAAHVADAAKIYDRKLEIIQNNLYGVDIDLFAVNIARLRLWLSLIVDYEGDNPPPLPNLDFKIEAGDSLTAPDPSGGLNLGFRGQLVDDFLFAKNKYTTAHHSEKQTLKEQINKLRADIKTWSGRNTSFSGFDWTIEFAEVFIAPSATSTMTGAMTAMVNTTSGQMEMATTPPAAMGFDVILANPPYVRADTQFNHIQNEQERQKEIAAWQAYRAQLKNFGLKNTKVYKTLHEKWDLYIPFLERAHQLLRLNGQMVFIIPDAYNAAKYAGKSHEFFLQASRIKRIDFCSEIDLFDAGVNNTILHFEKGAPTVSHQPVRMRRWGEIPDDFERNLQLLETKYQLEYDKSLFRAGSEQVPAINVNHVTLENICYISKGMVVHAEEDNYKGAFKLDDLISLTKDTEHPKPFVEGKDFAKWIVRRHKWLEYGTKRAPSQFSRPTFPELYEVFEKLISMDIASGTPRVVYDANKFLHNHSAWSFVPWHLLKNVINKSINKTAKYHHQDPLGNREQREETSRQFNLKYVLAIMNSSFAREWLKSKRRSKMHIYPDDWKQLPIAPISLEAQKEFVELVDKILAEYKEQGYPLPETSKEKVREWEGQLDTMVARLYE
jgi:adenine-specific DNA-methyltransferase